jgi:hypothetical protein
MLAVLPSKQLLPETLRLYPGQSLMLGGTVLVFRQKVALEDAIGSHAGSFEALACVRPTPSPLGCLPSYQLTL